MAITTTPLGFKKPDGNELARNGDNVIADNAQTAQDLIDNFKQLGISHVYLNNQYVADLDKWNQSLTQPRSEPLAEDIRNKWRQLVGDAIHEGKLKLTQQLSRTKALYEIAQ